MFNKIKISSQEQTLLVYIILAIASLAVFWQVNQFGFVYDDSVYVAQNRNIQSGMTLDGFRWAFSTKDTGLWNPVVWLSFMVDHQLFGLKAAGYHLTNLILHILSALLLFWLFNRMTGAVWKSAFVAAFFALHPLHVESVAWIAERKDVLSAFFWMLTLCLYVYYTEKPVIKRYLLVLFCFILALMSKPMVITLPVVMILLDYWPLKRFQWKEAGNRLKGIVPAKNPSWLLLEKIPLFVLSAALVIYTVYTPNKQEASVKIFSLYSRLANAPVAFATYLEKTFWPHDMTVFYPFSDQLPLEQVLGASLLILVISVVVMIMIKRLPFLLVGWLWFAVTIIPVIGIIQISHDAYAMADRYHYLPSIGLAMMMAWGIPLLIKSEAIREKYLFPLGITFMAIMALLTWQQCSYWKNGFTLFSHALQVTKNNYLAHNNVGLALNGKGRNNEAIDHYNKAIQIKPDYAYAYNNRGIAYGGLGQYQRAMEDFNEALRVKPNYAEAYNNKGFTYYNMGQYPLAIQYYNQAIAHASGYADAYANRAVVYLKHGSSHLGCLDAQKACELGNCRTFVSARRMGLCR